MGILGGEESSDNDNLFQLLFGAHAFSVMAISMEFLVLSRLLGVLLIRIVRIIPVQQTTVKSWRNCHGFFGGHICHASSL